MENLKLAFRKARKRKSNKPSVKKFEENLEEQLNTLKQELETFTYKPVPLKRFVIRDPKTRTIYASAFRDRVLHHAIINIIGSLFERCFIYDSYASRVNKGAHAAIERFDRFTRKVSKNGKLVRQAHSPNSIAGYVLKADIRHYFETVDHEALIKIIERKIRDGDVVWLIRQILGNYDCKVLGKGMPLGNYTSQFFANVYLNELDYFIKHELKVKYYIRYVDDFVIFHRDKSQLKTYKSKINDYLKINLKIELHKDKSRVMPLRGGVAFLGYRIFYHYKLLGLRNKRKFERTFGKKLNLYEKGLLSYEALVASLQGWRGHAIHANTYKLQRGILENILKLSFN